MEQRHLDLLAQLVAHQTPSPPGRNTGPLQDEVESLLKDIGFNIKRKPLYDNDSVIIATLKGEDPSAPKLILNGHMDVAAVDDKKDWHYPPFELTQVDEWLYGRGVSDMKGGMATLFYVLEQLHHQQVHPKGDIIVQSVVGEEVGEAGTKLACEHSPKADLALILDTSEQKALGQGGVITGWITIKSKETVHDGARYSMIHAGGGKFGANAIEKMTTIIHALNDLERHWAVMKSYEGMTPGANTINPAVIEGGRHPAFIADECRLWITVHYLPNESYETVVREIEDHLNKVAQADLWLAHHPLTYEWGGTSMIEDRGEIFPSFVVPTDHQGFKLLSHVNEKIHGSALESGLSTTVTDGGWTAYFGIPTILYGPGNLEEAHSVDEKIAISELENFSDVLLEFLKCWYKNPQK